MTNAVFNENTFGSSCQSLTQETSGTRGTPPIGIRRRLPGWARVLLALAAFEVSAFFPMLLSFIGPVKELLNSPDKVTAALAMMLALWPVALAVYLASTFLFTRYIDQQPLWAAGLTLNRRAGIGLLVGIAISVFLCFDIAIVFRLLGVPSIAVEQSQAPPWLVISYVIGVSFVAQGIGEEALWRGYVLQSFASHPKRAIWISVIFFTIPHLLSQGGQQNALDHVLYLAVAFGFSFTAAHLCVLTRSAWAGVGIHGGWHIANHLIGFLGLATTGPLNWLTNGAVFFIAGLIISTWISKERWNEMAERGPYALPITK